MKLKFLFLFLILISGQSYSQISLESYSLQGDKNYLSKISSDNPASNSITDIITVGDTVWLGTSRGVSLSTDQGENWTNFYGSESFSDLSISAIAYNKYDGSFWASTAKSVEVTGGDFLPEGRGLRYTTDGGLTWKTIQQPLDATDDSAFVYGINDGINLPRVRALPVTVAIQNLTYDIAFTPGTIWITSFAGGLRKSTDSGNSWQRVLLPSDNINEISPDDTIEFCLSPAAGSFCGEGNLNHRAFSVIAVDDSILYVGTAGGINKGIIKSTGEDISWVKFSHQNQDNPISGNFVVALGYNQTNNTVWGATWRAEDNQEFYGVSSSTNGGENWNTFLENERVHNFGFKLSSGIPNVIAPSDNGAFRTLNQGISWILPNSIIDNQSGLELLTSVFYSASSSGNIIWLGSNDGLVRLNENVGSFWSGEWKIYFAAPPLESDNDTYCYPNPFSPQQEVLKIKYSTGEENKKVTIRVFDFSMNIIRTVIQNADRLKGISDDPDRWDGKDENGNIVSNGVYFYRIDFDNDEPVFGKIIVLQ